MLRDLQRGTDAQIDKVVRIIQTVRPDILLINEFDHDLEDLALEAFAARLAQGANGVDYPHRYAPPQNSGVPSGYDLDRNGRVNDPTDAWGFGRFRGQYAMAFLSRHPIVGARDHSATIWASLDWAVLPEDPDGASYYGPDIRAALPLSSKGHWHLTVARPDGRPVHLLASHPTPPVFDGPEDRNGLRNADEIRFWPEYIDSAFGPRDAFVVLGDLNLDPVDGSGRHGAIRALLTHPWVQDPEPRSNGAAQSASTGGANAQHRGDPALDTADWRDDPGPGNLRVDYVLPSVALTIRGAGVFWPAAGEPGYDLIGSDGRASSDHRLVWVDVE